MNGVAAVNVLGRDARTRGTASDEAMRVRLGASAETAPEVLVVLASDSIVTVRAAVAMNSATPPDVDAVLATDADERVRTLLARKLSALVPSLSRDARDAMREQACATFSRLVADEAVRVRAAIADVVKELPGVPRDLILRLASDATLSVSEPVILLSPLLTPEDLLALVTTPPAEATPTLVARRPRLPAQLCDAIAASGHTDAIAAMLANGSAAIREATLDALVSRARDHESWHEPLVRRPTLSARAARTLSDIVTSQLLGLLASRGDLEPALAQTIQHRLAERLRPEPAVPERSMFEQASEAAPKNPMAAARQLKAENRLDEAALLAATHRGEARLACAMLAVAADLPVSVVERAATLRSTKGLVSLVWKAGFTMRAAAPVQLLLARVAPTAVLSDTSQNGFPLSLEEMRWQIDFLTRTGR